MIVYPAGKEFVSAEVKEIGAAMNRYYTDLSAIENVIRNWDPVKKSMVIPFFSS